MGRAQAVKRLMASSASGASPAAIWKECCWYQPLHATQAELLNRAGDRAAASDAYQKAISLTQNARHRARPLR